ncbi:MAG TPA: 16S rRNA (cytosine(1402)-N(4))-methyltransferase RsmH [Actinomycetota bacterium]|nr:16S rRNA (cytosine(1402)-N(4))-methyltransferase RsmH [Actinomycetota bacterium]
MEGAGHRPVMVGEVVRLLSGRGVVLDLTLGAGGHAEALLDAGIELVIGVDRDPAAVELAAARLSRFGDRFRAVAARFSNVPVEHRVDGVLYDLGVSSMQLDTPERGFSFRRSGPLDMRMGPEGESAKDVVNTATEQELARILFELGEERRSRRVAAAIVRARERAPITTTDELARVVAGAVGARRGGPHPARRTFQALRIAVNRELEELAASLPRAVDLLAPGGRLVAISYHSLEDRIVKRFLAARDDLEPLTKKPLTPSNAERARNPRARAAKLRAADKRAAA